MIIRSSRTRILTACFLSILCCTLPVVAMNSQERPTVRASETSIRKSANKSVMPKYPAESIKRGSKGLAVVDLEYDSSGNVISAEVLESPDDAIKHATLEAVLQWKFSPTKMNNYPVNVRGKLTFYFVLDDQGSASVKNPQQFN